MAPRAVGRWVDGDLGDVAAKAVATAARAHHLTRHRMALSVSATVADRSWTNRGCARVPGAIQRR